VVLLKLEFRMTSNQGLSIDSVKSCLTRFLTSNEASVVAIRGAWGVGKTHFWNELIAAIAPGKLHAGVKTYSYVSLFGIDSLEQFKYSIFENSLPRVMIGKPITLDTFSKNVGEVSEVLGKKALRSLFTTKPLSGFSKAVDSASFLLVRNSLICVDDLERKGNKLSAKDALGLISYLKEHRNCKIVLLLNDGEEEMEEYKKYREKVVDVEVTFSPRVCDNVKIAFSSGESILSLAEEYAARLGSSNIRTLLKTKRYLLLVSPIVEQLEIEVQKEIISSICLFSLCFYRAGNESIPMLEHVVEIGNRLYGLGKKNDDQDPEKSWNRFLTNFGYRSTNQLDKALAMGIEAGYFELDEIERLALARNEEILQQKSSQTFHDAWDMYHNTFDENEEELVEALQKSLVENAKTVNPTNLNGTVCLLRELGHGDAADKLITKYISARKDKPKIFDLKDYAFGSDVTDSKIREAFASEYEKVDCKPALIDVLKRLSSSNGWSPVDEEVLSESSPEDYVKIFESESGDHLDSYVRVGLKFREWADGDERREAIGKNVEEALRTIGRRSRLNRRRVRKFGVIIEDDA
jgi:hypothetical protein